MRKGKRIAALLLVITMLVNTSYSMIAGAAESLGSSGTETEQNASVKVSETEVTGNGSVGEMLATTISEQQAQTQELEQSANHITELTVSGTTAEVRYSTDTDAEIVVAIYDEDTTQMVASGKETVSTENNSVKIKIELKATEQMPTYFLASAFLLDAQSHRPLSDSFSTQKYTKDIQGLLASTTDNYDPDRVLNLDSDEKTNFLVYSENTKRLGSENGKNLLTDNGDGSYTIKNADETVTDLKAGDTFSYDNGNSNILLVKIKSITVNGNIVTIWEESNDVEMTDFFECVKIEADSDGVQAEVDTSQADPGITYEGNGNKEIGPQTIADEGNGSQAASHTFSINCELLNEKPNDHDQKKITLSGIFKYGYSIKIEYYVTLTHQYFSFVNEYTDGVSLEISGKYSHSLFLAEISIPIIPVALSVKLNVSLDIEVSGKISFTFSNKGTSGYSCTNGEFEDLSERPKPDDSFEISGKFSVAVKVGAKISIFEGLIEGGVNGSVGIEAEVKPQTFSYNNDMLHDCTACLGGELHSRISLECEISFLYGLFKWNHTFAEFKFKLTDFYWSESYGDFGLTTCPHIRYRVTAKALEGKSDKPVENAEITVINQNTGETETLQNPFYDTPTNVTGKDGKLEFYLSRGEYKVQADTAELSAENTVAVRGKTASVKLRMTESYGSVRLTAVDLEGNPVPGAVIAWTSLPDAPVTDEQGIATFKLPAGVHSLHISTNELAAVCKVTVKKNTVTEVNVIMGQQKPQRLRVVYGEYYEDDDAVPYAKISGLNLAEEPITDENGYVDLLVEPGMYNIQVYTDYQDGGINCFGTYSGPLGYVDDLIVIHVGDSDTFWTLNDDVLRIFGDDKYRNWVWQGEEEVPKEKIQKIIIEDGITEINTTFEDCVNLREVELADSITYMCPQIFKNCKKLEKVHFPAGLESLGSEAFYGCSSLKEAIIKSTGDIAQRAFSYCENLTTVQLPSGMSTIGVDFFSGCSNLQSIYIPENVTAIGYRAFAECKNLFEVHFSDAITVIDSEAFYGCESLSSNIILPRSLEVLRNDAFFGCTNIPHIELPEGLNWLGCAFGGCDSLTSLVIPASVEHIEGTIARTAKNLESVYFKGHKPDGLWNENLTEIQYLDSGQEKTAIGYYPQGDSSWEDFINEMLSVERKYWQPYAPAALSAATATAPVVSPGATESSQQIAYANEMEIDLTGEAEPSSGETMEEQNFMMEDESSEVFETNEDTIFTETEGTETETVAVEAFPAGEMSVDDPAGTVIMEESTLEVFAEGETSPSTYGAQFADLVANASYVFVAMRDAEAADLLAPSNLLYITQATANTDGNLSLDYIPIEDIKGVTKVFGETHKNLADAEITISEVTADGSVQFPEVTVVYDGMELEEDRDYRLSGDISIMDAGTYYLTLTGINEYSGCVTVSFEVMAQHAEEHVHSYGNWQTKTAATVFAAKTEYRQCIDCGYQETRSVGKRLDPTIKLNATSIPLKRKQSTTKVKVSGLAAGDSVVSWKSSNSKIVTVSSSGKIKAKNKTGKATITVTLASGKTAKVTVKVQKAAVTTKKIKGLPKKLNLRKKAKVKLAPEITPITSLQKVTYKSSNKKVATVNKKGVVVAKGKGTAKITVKSGKKSFKITVKVTK